MREWVGLVDRGDARERANALQVLKSAAPELVVGLGNDDPRAMAQAIRALARVGPELRSVVDADHTVAAIREVIGRKPDGRLVGPADLRMFIRVEAAKTLGHLGPPAVPVLVAILREKHSSGRAESLQSLAGMGAGARSALPAIQEAAGDRNERIRALAEAALRRIGGTR